MDMRLGWGDGRRNEEEGRKGVERLQRWEIHERRIHRKEITPKQKNKIRE
jgi:hypothetical protein